MLRSPVWFFLALFMVGGGNAIARPYESDAAYKAYVEATERGDLAEALRHLRVVASTYADDGSINLEMGILLLRQTAKNPNQCEAVEYLEKAVSLGLVYVTLDLLNSLYAGNWALAASLEGSEVARIYLSQVREGYRIKLSKSLGIDPEALRTFDVDAIKPGGVAFLCSR